MYKFRLSERQRHPRVRRVSLSRKEVRSTDCISPSNLYRQRPVAAFARLTSAYVRPTDSTSHGRTEFSLLEEELSLQESNLHSRSQSPILSPVQLRLIISMCGTLCVPHERKEILPETCSASSGKEQHIF